MPHPETWNSRGYQQRDGFVSGNAVPCRGTLEHAGSVVDNMGHHQRTRHSRDIGRFRSPTFLAVQFLAVSGPACSRSSDMCRNADLGCFAWNRPWAGGLGATKRVRASIIHALRERALHRNFEILPRSFGAWRLEPLRALVVRHLIAPHPGSSAFGLLPACTPTTHQLPQQSQLAAATRPSRPQSENSTNSCPRLRLS